VEGAVQAVTPRPIVNHENHPETNI